MKLRTIALGGAAVTVAGIVLWRRRRTGAPPAPVELGLADGVSAALDQSDAAVPELTGLAADLRDQLEMGG
jgi:hypothetical protein